MTRLGRVGRALAAACWVLAVAAPAICEESPSGKARGFAGVYALRGEQTVAVENADRLFMPASVHKLIVAAAALHHLGPEHRVTTTLRANGQVADGTLSGDLILAAAADPTWNERFFAEGRRAPLALLARRLATAGVRRVTGDLVIDGSRFPGRAFPTSRPTSEYAYGYAAPTSALAIDENTLRLEIAPGPRIGAPGTMRLLAAAAGPAPPKNSVPLNSSVRLINRIHTVSEKRHGAGTVDFLPVPELETIVARGEYPISEPPYVISLSVPTPTLYAARHLAHRLAEEGIDITGDVRLAPAAVTGAGPILARLESSPLAELLEPILTDSHNWYAEMLLLILAAEVENEGRLDVGLEIARRFLEEAVGCPPESFHLDDASGLSPYNLITPRTVVKLLDFARSQPWRATFLAALANNGEGTLKIWPGLPPVAAKTGSIRHTLALAGYLDPESTEPVIFAAFFNHETGDRGSQRANIARLLQRWRRGDAS